MKHNVADSLPNLSPSAAHDFVHNSMTPTPSNDVITLTDLTAMTVCSVICPYLDLDDLLSLRGTCRVLFRHLHKEEDISEEVWKLVLEREFGLPPSYGPQGHPEGGDGDKSNKFWIVPVQQSSGVSNLAPEGMVVSVPSRFEAVRAWKKVCSIYFAKYPCQLPLPPPSQTRRVYAPYFLRAACFWQNICRWCHKPDPGGPTNTQVRRNIYNSLKMGMRNEDWPDPIRNRQQNSPHPHGAHACQAVYAFCGGQKVQSYGDEVYGTMRYDGYDDEVEIDPFNPICTLFGATRAHGHISYMIFIDPYRFALQHGRETRYKIEVVVGNYLRNNIVVDEETGCVQSAIYDRPELTLPAVHLPNNDAHISEDDADNGDGGRGRRRQTTQTQNDHLLLWLEEHARRLQTGDIGIGRIVNDYEIDEKRAIVVYPRDFNRTDSSYSLSTICRTVTHGIEVVASSVYVPHKGYHSDFIISIRIQILHPNEDGYMSREDRGFQTCQLLERDWIIHRNKSDMYLDKGRGVIGSGERDVFVDTKFPILRDGGFTTEYGIIRDGPFEYQFFPSPYEPWMAKGGTTFCGYLTFVPDPPKPRDAWTRVLDDTAFEVEVGPITLDSQPAFLY